MTLLIFMLLQACLTTSSLIGADIQPMLTMPASAPSAREGAFHLFSWQNWMIKVHRYPGLGDENPRCGKVKSLV